MGVRFSCWHTALKKIVKNEALLKFSLHHFQKDILSINVNFIKKWWSDKQGFLENATKCFYAICQDKIETVIKMVSRLIYIFTEANGV